MAGLVGLVLTLASTQDAITQFGDASIVLTTLVTTYISYTTIPGYGILAPVLSLVCTDVNICSGSYLEIRLRSGTASMMPIPQFQVDA